MIGRHCITVSRFRIACTILLLGSTIAGGFSDSAHARKELLTADEKDLLHRAEHIRIEALTLSSHGPLDNTGVIKVVAARFERLGYRLVTDETQPHDVTVKVKCEELKTWEGTGRSGGDADMVDAAARLWKGPACQLSYRFGSRWADWRHEVRTPFSNPQEAARQAGQTDADAYAIAALIQELQSDPFPLLLAADLGQSTRLLKSLEMPGVPTLQKQTIIGLLGQMLATDAIPALTTSLNDPDPAVAQAAATALGTIGHEDSIPALLTLFALSVLRLAIFELLFSSTSVPPKVIIDEAIEIGKEYGNESSGSFINAVLGSILKDRNDTSKIQS